MVGGYHTGATPAAGLSRQNPGWQREGSAAAGQGDPAPEPESKCKGCPGTRRKVCLGNKQMRAARTGLSDSGRRTNSPGSARLTAHCLAYVELKTNSELDTKTPDHPNSCKLSHLRW